MAIIYCDKRNMFYLESKDTTYAFYINKIGFPEHLYYGKRVGHDALNYAYSGGATSHRAYIPEVNISYNDLPAEAPFYGNGDFREPMVQIMDGRGDRLIQLVYESHEILPVKPAIPGMPSRRGGETLRLTLKDMTRELRVILYYTVYEDASAIVRRTEIVNGGTEPVDILRAYSFCLDLPRNDYELITLHGAWARECESERVPMHHGVTAVDSKRGSSSATNNPFMVFTTIAIIL